MLTELKVNHFAIIDNIHIQFDHGLNILSGETGAGKSILIKSLALLMGAKASPQDIRAQKKQATIEGAFDITQRKDILQKLEELGIDTEDNVLIVRRILQKEGKSKIYLNGSLSTLTNLKKIVFPLVTLSDPTETPLLEITGQHENRDLISNRYQMDSLDQFCGNQQLRKTTQEKYTQVKEIQNKISEYKMREQQREQRLDFISYQISEIKNLDLSENEDQHLKEQIRLIRDKSQNREWLQQITDRLSSDSHSIQNQLQELLKMAPKSTSNSQTLSRLQDIQIQTEELAYDLAQNQEQYNSQEPSLDELEDRLSRIRKMQKKFGPETSDILRSLKALEEEKNQLETINEKIEALSTEVDKCKQALYKDAKKLSKRRSEGAALLSREVNEELQDLNMKGLEFIIQIEALADIQAHGLDQIFFMTCAGHADQPRSLSKGASGGELSRILLALKQVTGSGQHPRTFLFDEVDTGVSGPTAEKVGAKLKNLSKYQQVICVTHLPQVACFADHHFYISKNPCTDLANMTVTKLQSEKRVQEIARLISGSQKTQTSIAHAKQLLHMATDTKSKKKANKSHFKKSNTLKN